jgi:transcriptional regulator with XRE-family HTH domain
MAARKRKPHKKRKGRPAPGEKKGDKTLAERLVYVRKRVGLTRVEVSEATGVNYESLSGYELGQEHPPFRRIRLLAIFYGCSLDYLAGITDRLALQKPAGRRRRR